MLGPPDCDEISNYPFVAKLKEKLHSEGPALVIEKVTSHQLSALMNHLPPHRLVSAIKSRNLELAQICPAHSRALLNRYLANRLPIQSAQGHEFATFTY